MTSLAGSAGVRQLAQMLRDVPPESRRTVSRRMRVIGERVRADAAGNASWSSRIPGSLRVTTRFTGRFPGVRIEADAGRAPHARPYEGITGTAQFRHPVYGNRSVWVAQACRPFLRPAVARNQSEVVAEVTAAVGEAVTRSGL